MHKVINSLTALFVASVVALSACGSDDGTNYWNRQEEFKDSIRTCIAMDGTPEYISDEDGIIHDYFGCVTDG